MTTPHELAVLYRDDFLIAVNKPAQLFVHKSDLDRTAPAVLPLLRDQIGCDVHPIHRLDRPTSGVLLFTTETHLIQPWTEALASGEKTYLALVRGNFCGEKTVDKPLSHLEDKTKIQSAITKFRSLKNYAEATLVEAKPQTGRTHQIRRHLSHLAHQILGDTTYGKGRINQHFREHYALTHLFLHCSQIALTHAILKTPLTINADLPEDLKNCLTLLENESHLSSS
jgi:tRNA pseudouridine65 synthase